MLTDCRRDDAAQFFLVFTVTESGFLPGIGKKSAFNQNPGTVDFLHQIDAADGFTLSVAARIQRFNQFCLQLLPQLFATLRLCVKHLRPAVAGITELVLVNADKQGVAGFIDDSDPLLQV